MAAVLVMMILHSKFFFLFSFKDYKPKVKNSALCDLTQNDNLSLSLSLSLDHITSQTLRQEKREEPAQTSAWVRRVSRTCVVSTSARVRRDVSVLMTLCVEAMRAGVAARGPKLLQKDFPLGTGCTCVPSVQHEETGKTGCDNLLGQRQLGNARRGDCGGKFKGSSSKQSDIEQPSPNCRNKTGLGVGQPAVGLKPRRSDLTLHSKELPCK